MAAIVNTNFLGIGDRSLDLGNEEWGRNMFIGSNWVKLRLGVMIGLVPNGTANIEGGHFRMGLSRGRGSHLGAEVPMMWYGMTWADTHVSNSIIGGTATYNAGSGNPYFTGLHGRIRANNGVLTSASTTGDAVLVPATTGTILRRWPLVCDFEKTGDNLKITPYYFLSSMIGTVNRDFTPDDFVNMMESTGSPIISGITVPASDPAQWSGFPAAEAAYGELIAIKLGWTKTLVPIRIYGVAASRLL